VAGRAVRPGQAGEDLACAYLLRKGLRIVERNFRCRSGEIDVIARDGETLVFVEVKERAGASHGGAIEAVTRAKRARVVRAARLYAAQHALSEAAVRFDVIAIDLAPEGPQVRHEAGAFDAAGG
jgi:putative endonuclease